MSIALLVRFTDEVATLPWYGIEILHAPVAIMFTSYLNNINVLFQIT